MNINKVSICNEEVDFNIINNKKGIHSLFVERQNASFLKLYFSDINLPRESYVEFECGDGSIQREFLEYPKLVMVIQSHCVNIRVVLPKKTDLDHTFSLYLNVVEHDGRAIDNDRLFNIENSQQSSPDLEGRTKNSHSSIIGLGGVSTNNIELTPISSFEKSIPISLSEGSCIRPVGTIEVKNHESYSILKVQAIDLLTNEIFPLIFKVSLISDNYQTNLYGDITGDILLKLYDFCFEKEGLIKFWVMFKISDDKQDIETLVARVLLDNYDPYNIPFDINDAEVLDFNLIKNKKCTTGYILNGSDDYGFVALYRDEGPMSLVWFEKRHTIVKGLLKSPSGDEILVSYRALRITDSYASSMNTAATSDSTNKYSELVLEYFPEDNRDLILRNDVYEGIIPLQAKSWQGDGSKNILVKVKLSVGE